jgi:hypothetical protein
MRGTTNVPRHTVAGIVHTLSPIERFSMADHFSLASDRVAVIDSCPMKYRCVASTPEGLVQQVAVSYLRHGYWWYTTGRIPGTKNPEDIDRKLVAKYGIDISERQRAHRKARGLANMQYIRFKTGFFSCVPKAITHSELRRISVIAADTRFASKGTPSVTVEPASRLPKATLLRNGTPVFALSQKLMLN